MTRIKISTSFLLAAVFLLLSHFSMNRLENGISGKNIDAIEKILHNLQHESQSLVNKIIACSNGDSNIPDIDSIAAGNLQAKGIYIFVTDSLSSKIRYWSDNLPVTVEKLKNVTQNPQYMFLGNGWYVAAAQWSGGLKYMSLILVKKEYLYQNQFLKDGTNPEFHFPENIIVQPLDADIGIAVRGANGAPLFIVNSDIPTMEVSVMTLVFRWLALFFVFAGLLFIFYNPGLYRKSPVYLIVFLILLAGLRILFDLNSEFFTGKIYLFSPLLYADSEKISSLGGLLMHVLSVLFLIIALFLAKEPLSEKLNALSQNKKTVFYLISCILLAFFLCFILYISKSLVLNSEISFKIHKMNNITGYTLVAYLVFGIVFAELCLFAAFQAFIFGSVKKSLQYFLPAATAVSAVLSAFGFGYENLPIIVLYIFVSYLFINKENRKLSLFAFVWIVALISIYAAFSLIINTIDKEHKKRELLAQNLLSERDPVVEMLLKDIENKIPADHYVQNIVNSGRQNQNSLYNVLIDRYFRGYFQRYDLHLTVCKPDENLHILDEGRYENCLKFFEKQCESRGGIPLSGSSHFKFMNNFWGRIHYCGSFQFADNRDTTYLFLELYLKHEIKAIGYPELLKFDSKNIDFELEEYSYAKYANGILVANFGAYDYTFELPQKIDSKGFFEKNGYSHCLFDTGNGNAVILSQPGLTFSGVVSMFSYSFVIFILIFLLLFTISGLKLEISPSRNSYRWRITVVILSGIIGALTILTVAMIAYTIAQSEKNNREDIQSRMQSVLIELESLFDKEISPETLPELENTLIRLSNAFYTDLNIYDVSGDLTVSSRNEIFEKNLTGTKMNRAAFRALTAEKQSKYIHTERIGEMNYFSSYITCYNKEGEAVAFLNLPYFDKQFKVRNELLSLTGAIMNIYIFLIVIGIALSVFISNQITKPLDLVRKKMAKLNFNEQPEPIDYRANNELGNLVREYNRMIGELAESAKIMAENERESAWREMARQIAHEIKNPLTPMKLNIQLALRMKGQNREGWQEKMESAMKSILEQIDILSNIASEFSNFARTGKVELEPVDLALSVTSSISLFSGYKNLILNFYRDETKKYVIKANKEQLQRVLTNMIKNSIQATENVSQPEISLRLDEGENSYVLSISDNGTGISAEAAKNLFHPNFTTKSGGTGLGLAISKGIIESFGGTISFVPQEVGVGFEIELKAEN